MSSDSKIEWTDATWNFVTGCTEISTGCDRCYAKTFAERWRGVPGHHFEQGFDVRLRPELLDLPLHWRKPRRIFTNSMSDLFHKDVPDEFIAKAFAVMACAPRHTFQVLTKRHARMRSLLSTHAFWTRVAVECLDLGSGWPVAGARFDDHRLLNVWLGVSAEDQRWAEIRIPALVDTPAAVRWVSAEPLIGPLSFWPEDHAGHERDDCGEFGGWTWTCLDCSGPEDEEPRIPWKTYDRSEGIGIDWLVAGGESGAGARRCDLAWLRLLRDECADAGVPYFCKQLGSVLGKELGAGPKGGDWDHWPEDLRVRQFPASPVAVSS